MYMFVISSMSTSLKCVLVSYNVIFKNNQRCNCDKNPTYLSFNIHMCLSYLSSLNSHTFITYTNLWMYLYLFLYLSLFIYAIDNITGYA